MASNKKSQNGCHRSKEKNQRAFLAAFAETGIIYKAAEAAGKDAPRIVAGLPIAVTNDVAGAKEQIAEDLKVYGMLPSYRAMLDREGAAGPADIALVGDEATVRAGIARLRDIGVTDFSAAITPTGEGVAEATMDLLADELG